MVDVCWEGAGGELLVYETTVTMGMAGGGV